MGWGAAEAFLQVLWLQRGPWETLVVRLGWGSSLLSDRVTEFSWILEHISIYLETVSEWGVVCLNDRDNGGRYSQRNTTEAIPQDFSLKRQSRQMLFPSEGMR